MNIHELDLNLLTVFDAIYKEGSTAAAAKKLGLSQSAISNALRRLRDFTGDTLFFRSGNRMTPTRVANTLALPVGNALSLVSEGLHAVRGFNPATSARSFRVAANDILRIVLAPTLVSTIEREAPHIVLELADQNMSAEELQASLRSGKIDLGLLPSAVIEGDMKHEIVLNEQLVLVVRRNHPALSRPVTTEMLAGLRYVASNIVLPVRTLVDGAFRQAGVERNVVCLVPGWTEVPLVVEVSDLIGVMGRSFALSYMRDHAITILSTPVVMPQVKASLLWAHAFDDDEGLKWLRQRVVRILRAALSMNAAAEPAGRAVTNDLHYLSASARQRTQA